MSEYVCDIRQDYLDVPYDSDDFSGTLERRERVVRCRDCVYYKHKAIGNPNKGYFREWDYCDHWAEDVEPDGFCAWGEPRGGK